MDELHDVALVDFPVTLYVSMQAHHDQLLRVCAEVAAPGAAAGNVETSVLRMAEELTRQFAAGAHAFDGDVSGAQKQGDPVTTLDLKVDLEGLQRTEGLLLLFDESDEYSRAGALPMAAASPDTADFRRWLVGEMMRQIRDGAPPTPYWLSTR